MDDLRKTEVASEPRASALSPAWYRTAPPESCPDCGETASRTARFCWSCRLFLRDRWVGKLASAKRRLVAAMLDSAFRDGGTWGLVFWNAVLPGSGARVLAVLAAIYTIASLYLWSKGTTPGKQLLGMRVITADGRPAGFFRMAIRETVAKTLSLMVFGLGVISIPFDKEKRGWHDKMMGTWVVLEEE